MSEGKQLSGDIVADQTAPRKPSGPSAPFVLRTPDGNLQELPIQPTAPAARSLTDENPERITDLDAAREQRIRASWLEILIRHAITIWLLFALTVLSPLSLALLMWAGGSERISDILASHRTWETAIAGLTGTAIGAYFVSNRGRKNERGRS